MLNNTSYLRAPGIQILVFTPSPLSFKFFSPYKDPIANVYENNVSILGDKNRAARKIFQYVIHTKSKNRNHNHCFYVGKYMTVCYLRFRCIIACVRASIASSLSKCGIWTWKSQTANHRSLGTTYRSLEKRRSEVWSAQGLPRVP